MLALLYNEFSKYLKLIGIISYIFNNYLFYKILSKKGVMELESYLLVLASLILLIPIIMYLPLGITFKGKFLIILGAIIVSLIGIYANMNFPLWQTAGMLLVLIISMTFFMGEKFEGLIFDQEGHDLTDFKNERLVEEIEKKDDLLHIVDNHKQTNSERLPHENKQQSELKLKDNDAEIVTQGENVSGIPMMDVADELPTNTEEQSTPESIRWNADIDLDLLQEEPIQPDEVKKEVIDNETIEEQTIKSQTDDPINEEEGVFPDEMEPYGSLSKDEVAFLLNKEESMNSEDLFVHYMGDIESVLEDEEGNLQAATDLVEDEPEIEIMINVFEEEELPFMIDEMEAPLVNEMVTEDQSEKKLQSEIVEPKEELHVYPNGHDSLSNIPLIEWQSSDEEQHHSKPYEASQQNKSAEVTDNKDDKSDLMEEPVYVAEPKEVQSAVEYSALQTQLLDTLFYQVKLAKISYSDDEYVALIKAYLTDELPDQTFYQFSTLLLHHYIEKHEWDELNRNLVELKNRFQPYPILAKQLDYLYQTYCA